MKRFLLHSYLLTTLSVFIFMMSSCKKSGGSGGSSSGAAYYVKFKLDGVQKIFTADAEGNCNEESSVGNYASSIVGLNKIFVVDTSSLTIGLSYTADVVANVVYTNYATTTAGEKKATIALITYYDESGVFFAAWPDDDAFLGVISDARITFTSITSSSLKGNFSGTLYKAIDGTSPKHVVTEGEFYIKRVN